MPSNIDEVSQYILDSLKSVLDDMSEYEEGIVKQAILFPYATVTNAKTVLSDRIDDAIRCKSDLNYIILRLRDRRKVIQVPYETEYNKLFTMLTRQQRPSKQAIDSEIKYTRPAMADTADRLEEYDKIIGYLTDVQAVLDLAIRNTESRRYNL